MHVFSSLLAARREGFLPSDYSREYNLWIVERTRRNRVSGRLEKMLAFAQGGEN